MFRQKSMNKEAIIAEYLAGGITYRALADKYGVDFRTHNYWVRCYQGRTIREKKQSPTATMPSPRLTHKGYW